MTEKKKNDYNEYLAKLVWSLRECSGNDKVTCDCSKCLFVKYADQENGNYINCVDRAMQEAADAIGDLLLENNSLGTNLCLMDDILKKLEHQNKEENANDR